MMSRADKLFYELGYEKTIQSKTLVQYETNTKIIDLGCPDANGYPVVFAYMTRNNIVYARGITMKEFKAIKLKLKEMKIK